jgi:hypothetical protein
LDEAMREFEIALKQSRGKFVEARENLALCQRMLDSSAARLIAALKTVDGNAGAAMKAE